MLTFIKKQGIAFYLMAVAAIFILIATILYGINSTGFFEDTQPYIVTFSIISILLCIGLMIAPQFIGNNKFLDIAKIVIVVFLAIVIIGSLGGRVTQMGYSWFTELDTTPAALDALAQYLVLFIFYLIGAIAAIAGGFFNIVKEDK